MKRRVHSSSDLAQFRSTGVESKSGQRTGQVGEDGRNLASKILRLGCANRSSHHRICGDYKLTVNKVAKLEAYPLPHVDDLFASLAGGVAFSKLDLANAYQRLEPVS